MKNNGLFYTPYSGVQNTIEGTPALKHFFPCTEDSGNVITDVAGGVVWDTTGQLNIQGNPISFVRDSTLGAIEVSSSVAPIAMSVQGTFAPYDITKVHLYMASFRHVGAVSGQGRISLGNNNALGDPIFSGFGLANTHVAVGYQTNPDDGLNWTARINYSEPTTTNWDNNLVGIDTTIYAVHTVSGGISTMTCGAYNSNTGAAIFTANGTETYTGTPATAVSFPSYMRFFDVWLYGVALYEFTALPSDWLVGVLWNGASWKQGNKKSYPRWLGL